MKEALKQYRNDPEVEKIARVIARKLGHNDDSGMEWDCYVLPAIGVYLEIVKPDRRVSADMIAMFLSEEARIEGERIANVSYLAVGIADRIERGELRQSPNTEENDDGSKRNRLFWPRNRGCPVHLCPLGGRG